MKTKLLITLLCLIAYISTSQAQCTSVPNQNTVRGTVFSDVNQNGSLGSGESGINNVSVDLYQDNNGDGVINSGDVIVDRTTSNASGAYTFVIAKTTTTNNVLDQFNSTSYTNNNGSENWSNNWQEIGESNGATSGNVRVNNNKLRLGADTKDNRYISGDGVDRIVDLSTYTTATLSFNFTKAIDSGNRDWTVNLQISTNGTTYTTLENFSFTDTQRDYSYDISAYISATTHIRFVGSGEQEKEKDDYLFFDNINVSYTKTDTAYPNYIVSIDAATIPSGYNKTTSSFEVVKFTAFGQIDCDNNFGLYRCGPVCAPVAEDDYATIEQGEAITLTVLDNDSDGDRNIDVESVYIISDPTNGSISIDDFGNIIYSPNGDFVGTDSFVYEVCDETFLTPLCDSATVHITVLENFIDPCFQAVQQQIYYVPFSDNELRTALYNSGGSGCLAITNEVNRIISIKSPYPGAIITYDHWEDGYEADINNPTQSTTQVWGDKDITNGTSPEYSDDYIPSGGDIVLENTYNYNPRNASIITYDGKDKIHTSNDIALSVVAGDVDRFDIQLAKTDVYNVAKFGTSFIVPFGEELGNAFQYTGLFIRAANNSTIVNIDLDNNGSIDKTDSLNEGEVMFVDGGVNSGATITSNKPIGVDLFFGGLDCFGTRQINILPGKFNSDTYYSPVPTTKSSAPSVVYFYNSLSRSIKIDWTSKFNSGTILVAAKSSASISLSDNSGYKFQSQGGESFVASEVIDSDSNGAANDWSFNLISKDRLTDFTAIAWAPGTSDYSANYNPVWVTPTANTTLYVKYDGNLEDASAPTSPCGIKYDRSFTLNALDYIRLFDTFNNDNDQSGMALYTCDGTKIFAVYGQDAAIATTGVGTYTLDVGTTMQPMCLKPLVLANDDTTYGLIDTPIDILLPSNDTAFLTSLNPGSITTTGLLQPENGIITLNPNGTLTYIPNEGFIGVDVFEYSICSQDFPDVCDTATVTISVSACASPSNKNIVYGQVFFDLNEDTINNDDLGVNGIKVKIYNDVNVNGAVDSGDVLISTVTTNNEGYYNFEAPNYNEAIAENFSSNNYSGGTGWSNNWTEVDNGNPLTGDVRIEGSRKRLLVKNNKSIYRRADLSGVANANISFNVREYGNLEADDNVVIQICSDNSFSNCQTIFIKANDFVSETVNGIAIDADKLTSTSTFRVKTNGYTSSDERFYIDNIVIRYEVVSENLIIETDLASYPAGYVLSTDNVEVANFPPGSFGNCEKDNDFGVLRCNLIESGLVFNCNDNGTPLDTSDDFYNITLNPEGSRLGGSYTISGDITGSGTYGTPKSFGPFPVSDGNKVITIKDTTGNCMLEDIEISVSQYSCINLIGEYTLDFDGVDDYLTTGSFIQGLNDVSVMAWVKSDIGNSTKMTILGEELGCRLYLDNGRKPVFSITTDGNSTQNLLATDINYNEWHHIAGTFSSATGIMKIYVDGKLTATKNTGFIGSPIKSTVNTINTFEIGRLSSNIANKQYFKGDIDEVRVFNTVLTDTQIQGMVYQEIEVYSGKVRGRVIPKNVIDVATGNTVDWSNLIAYYPMTDIKEGKTSDYSVNDKHLTLKNITTIQEQTAPMPYRTKADGNWTTQSTWLHGDVWDIEDAENNKDWSIVKIQHNVTTSNSHKSLGLFIDVNKKLDVNGVNQIQNSWYLELNGTLDLKDDSQLVQTNNSDLVTNATGKILRRREGTTNVYWYNYLSSPVGTASTTVLSNDNAAANNEKNTTYQLNFLKEGNGNNVQFTSSYNQVGKVSTRWLYTYKNGLDYYDWAPLPTGTDIEPGVGYTQKGTGNSGAHQQYIFEGKPNNGTIQIPVTDVGGDGSQATTSKTEYLLGNPYPSALDIYAFIDDNVGIIDGTLQLWQQWSGSSHNLSEYNGGYAQVNKTGSVRASQFVGMEGADNGSNEGTQMPTRYLPVGQAFITEIKKSGNVVFNNAQRVFIKEGSGSVFFKEASSKDAQNTEEEPIMQKIRLELNSISGPASRRELLLGFSEFTTDAFDYGYEAVITETNATDLNSTLDDQNLLIQAYSKLTNDKVVPLNFRSSGDFTFEIKITEMEAIDEDQTIFLKDNLLGSYFDLRNQKAYSFTSAEGEFRDRFEIVFQNGETLSTEKSDYVYNLIYFDNESDKLFVKGLNADVKKLMLINILGQTVKEYNKLTPGTLDSGLSIPNLSSGTYVVYFTTDTMTKTKKIMID